MSPIPYEQQTLKAANPLARFAHQSRYSIALRRVEQYLPTHGSLLDFGCGQGTFLKQLRQLKPEATLWGLDRQTLTPTGSFTPIESLTQVPDHSLDIITAFEVFEHMYPQEQLDFYQEAQRRLRPEGILIISVPIVGGPTLLLKELNKMVMYRRGSVYTLKELWLATVFGIPASRPENVRSTHKGFDFRQLEQELQQHFQLVSKQYSPFAPLPWYLNSQVFFQLVRSPNEYRSFVS